MSSGNPNPCERSRIGAPTGKFIPFQPKKRAVYRSLSEKRTNKCSNIHNWLINSIDWDKSRLYNYSETEYSELSAWAKMNPRRLRMDGNDLRCGVYTDFPIRKTTERIYSNVRVSKN